MKGYIFYSNTDHKKEPISYGRFSSLKEAVNCFAKIKRLPIKEFNNIFTVEKHGNDRSKKEN